MSGQAIQSPASIDTGSVPAGAAAGSITPVTMQIIVDSLSGIASSTQTGNYTLALTDRGTRIRYNSTSPGTFTIPPNASVAFVVNTTIMFQQVNTGQLAIAAGAGVTIINTSSLTARVQGSPLWAIQDSANTWILSGDLT